MVYNNNPTRYIKSAKYIPNKKVGHFNKICCVLRKYKWSLLIVLTKMGWSLLINYLLYYYRLLFSKKYFVFRENKLRYFYHLYNTTFRNERCIEIPIAFYYLKGKSNILEFGNVLSHYISFPHDILDKYEEDAGVINEDVAEWQTTRRYDCIISISTLEHVGWDEPIRDDTKILRSIENLKKHLAVGGVMVFTMPLGHNSILDDMVKNKLLGMDRQIYLRRTSRSNKWEESFDIDFKSVKYGSPFPNGNVVVVGVYEKLSKELSKVHPRRGK